MAYDEKLADRIRKVLARKRGMEEKKMFGGLAFMRNGHMCCGVVNNDLMLRLGEDGVQEALKKSHTRPMDFTGKPMKTMIYVHAKGIQKDVDLAAWVKRAVDFASSLPPK